MSIQVHFHGEDWARIEAAWTAWWAGELPRPLVVIEDLAPPPDDADADILNLGAPASTFPLDVPVDALLDHYQARLEARRYRGDAWPKWWPNFGPGIAAGFLGARVHATADTTWFEPVEKVA
ncbi:MAG: hypothetical protein PVJ34_16735, partial [Anaerolineae bacterium]